MAAIIEKFLVCDECGENFGVDFRDRTAREHRISAKLNDWVYRKGKDYCPKCALKLGKPRTQRPQ